MSNNGGDMAQRAYALYLQCLENLKKDDPSLYDEVLVGCWRVAEAAKIQAVQLSNLVNEQQKELCAYYRKQDILESRIALLTKSKNLNGEDIKQGEH